MLNNKYKVEYYVTRTLDTSGEFSKEQVVERHSLISVTNDLSEIFTDIFDLQRSGNIIGIEIISVKNIEEKIFQDHSICLN